ncbi:hypothetical protein [Demequina sp. SO4-18]|uniref:phage scaffolding protein n=1 Tax=Demequina sp. SO4-18 TaxID=3401026 RepID=UPI003B5B3A6A
MLKFDWLTRAGMLILNDPPAPGGGDPAPADPPTPDPAPEATDPPEPDPEGADDLGDKGKKALDAMKAKVKEANSKATAAAEERDRLKAAAEGREAEWETERKAEKEREEKFRARYLKAEIKAAAKGVLADPEDAFKFLDLDDFEVTEDGDVDTDAIASALKSLAERKSYLAVQDGPRFNGSSDSGPRNDGPRQVTKDQLSTMTHAEIDKARREGRLDRLLGKN